MSGSLITIAVDDNNSFYSSLNGVLFNKDKTTLIQCPGGLFETYMIPSSVTSIGDGSFAGCRKLTNIPIPDSVTNIGNGAFNACTLTNVMIGNHVTRIGEQAFSWCLRLTSVTISESVNTIGRDAFLECINLANVTVVDGNPVYSSLDGVLFNKDKTTLIICPIGKSGCFTIPDSVISIGDLAFNSCTGLTSIVIGNRVTTIGNNAFRACFSLSSVTIPSSVTNIGSYVFSGCSKLRSLYFKGDVPFLNPSSLYSPATIYYLPNTTGWSTSFVGQPTLCWNPQVQHDANFGFASDRFGFTIAGTTNIPVVVEACTNLASNVWTPLTNSNLGTSGSFHFADPASTNAPARFYRIVWPQ